MTNTPFEAVAKENRNVGFGNGLRLAAHIARQKGDYDLADKLYEIAQSDVAYKLANMPSDDVRVVFAAAVSAAGMVKPRRGVSLVVDNTGDVA